MSFTWNLFGPVNLAIDLAIVAFAVLCIWFNARKSGGFPHRPSYEAFRILRLSLLISFIPSLIGTLIVGGTVGFFLLSRIIWTTITVTLPLIGFYLWYRWRKNWLWLLVLVPIVFKYYGEVWEPGRLEVQHVQIPLATLSAPLRIVHLSDLQTDGIRSMHYTARRAANDFDPHLVLFTGDTLNHSSLIAEVSRYLKGFKHRQGAFFVSGNVDDILELESFCRNAGFQYLDGKAKLLDINGVRLGILGLGIFDFQNSALLNSLIRQTEKADIRVLMTHAPDALDIARNAPIDILFSGHTHGGQACLPWLGPVFTFSGVSRRIAAGGLHRVGKLWVMQSRGLGMEGHVAPRIRTFCRPHLVLIELIPEKHRVFPS